MVLKVNKIDLKHWKYKVNTWNHVVKSMCKGRASFAGMWHVQGPPLTLASPQRGQKKLAFINIILLHGSSFEFSISSTDVEMFAKIWLS